MTHACVSRWIGSAANAMRRAGVRQAAPLAEALRPDPKRPGPTSGRADGPNAHRRVPPRIDEHHDVSLPTAGPACQAPVIETGVATPYPEEFPVAPAVVRAFLVHIGQCQGCGRRVAGQWQWLSAFATPTTTVDRIQPGRGVAEAAAVLGVNCAGVLVGDG